MIDLDELKVGMIVEVQWPAEEWAPAEVGFIDCESRMIVVRTYGSPPTVSKLVAAPLSGLRQVGATPEAGR